ncbi:MAG: hypothetical protein QM785_02135 [Pyrinomonadaceae bacterium]
MWKELNQKTRLKRTLQPYASINPRGEIVLNPTVFAKLNGIYYVSLRYEDETGTIVIARPNAGRHIYRVRPFGRKGRLRVIRAKRFLTHLRLRIPETLRFTDIRFNQDPDRVILSLQACQSGPRFAANSHALQGVVSIESDPQLVLTGLPDRSP